MNKERLNKLADFLDGLDSDKFDYSNVVTKFDSEQSCGTVSCGTVCCAMGWTPLVFPELVHWSTKGDFGITELRHLIDGEVSTSYSKIGESIFGIDNADVHGLFDPCGQFKIRERYDTGDDNPFDSQRFPDLGMFAKPKQVAQLIRNYIELIDSIDLIK